jgi:hypothetical protein
VYVSHCAQRTLDMYLISVGTHRNRSDCVVECNVSVQCAEIHGYATYVLCAWKYVYAGFNVKLRGKLEYKLCKDAQVDPA